MLTIRRSQLAAFTEPSMRRFEDALVAHLQQAWPRECRLAGDDEQMLRVVRAIVPAARRHGYRTSREITLYALIVFSLGLDFDTDPQCTWAADGLGNLGIANTTARIEAVYDDMVMCLGAIGGTDSERVVRALLRVRRHDFTRPLSADPEERIAEICDLLEAFWPEKFEFQEAGPTERLVRASVARAARHGITGSTGESVFATLAYFLGHAFEQDPMHPWAADALRDSAPGEPRALMLMHAGLGRLAASLTAE